MMRNIFVMPAKEFPGFGRCLSQILNRRILVFYLMCVSVIPSLSAAEIVYDSGGRRDPFIPLVSAEGGLASAGDKKPSGDYHVEGIVFDPKEGSFALINGKFYKKGDQVDRAQLVSIFRDRVILNVNSEEKVVWLREEAAEK